MVTPPWDRVKLLREANLEFASIVSDAGYPCVGARAAQHAGSYIVGAYERLGDLSSARELHLDLAAFINNRTFSEHDYATFIAVFASPPVSDERDFEQSLWRELQELHTLDTGKFEWDQKVSADPTHSEFSFSVCGQAFYIVGMHPAASRIARRFPWPALVFNPHAQFERLRNNGQWQRMQKTIRQRELAMQGSINPMLSDFGSESEARQYSGRAVAADWTPSFEVHNDAATKGRCPFTGRGD